MMDKDWRLQRYHRKDYGELVDFPVEIVGRDGVVRRYTFEDSVRLYQRRITFAPLRYREVELVKAEVAHCRSRIDQLRRSYFYRHGWGTPDGQPRPTEVFGGLAGELAAFLCRALRCPDRPDVSFEPIGAPTRSYSEWELGAPGVESDMHLDVFQFDGVSADPMRDRFFARLRTVEQVTEDAGEERLIAFHHTVDCGFILTTRAEAEPLLTGETPAPAVTMPSPWDDVQDLVRRGQLAFAMSRCRALVREQPWHRRAYVMGAALAAHLNEPILCEDLALVGSKYFPQDSVLPYYIGLARLRQGRLAEAVSALQQAVTMDYTFRHARLLLVVARLQSRTGPGTIEDLYALAKLPDVEVRHHYPVPRGPGRRGRRVGPATRRLRQWVYWRRLMIYGGVVAALAGVTAAVFGALIGLLPGGIGLVMAVAGHVSFKMHLRRLVSGRGFDDLAVGMRHIRSFIKEDIPVA